MEPHEDARYIAISPDKKLVATGSHGGKGACIWKAETAAFVTMLMPEYGPWGVEFSADGQWLATQNPFCQLWRVGTWEKGLIVRSKQFCFSPDGKLIAVETGDGVARLLDPASGREFARLENSYQDVAYRFCFSPDGGILAMLAADRYPIHVWDLRKIRRQLKELDLDWDLPDYPPESPAWSEGPLQLKIDLGQLSTPQP